MTCEHQEAIKHPLKGWLTRDVAKRCLVASVLAIPGLLNAKRGTSIDMVLSSAVVGCVVMVLVSIPLAILASGADLARISPRLGTPRMYAVLAIPIVFSGAGFALAVYHGLLLSPVNLAGMIMVTILAIYSFKLTYKAMAAQLEAPWLICADAILVTGGLFYGTFAGMNVGVTGFPSLLVAGICAVACLVFARGRIVRFPYTDGPFDRHGIEWFVVMAASIALMLVASLVASNLVPMAYPALATIICSAGAMVVHAGKARWPGSRLACKWLISAALVCAAIAILVGSI